MPKPISELSVFVMSQPETLTDKEIAAKAKEAGFTTNAVAVSQTRRRAKKRAAEAARKPAPTKAATALQKAAPQTTVPGPKAERKPTVPHPANAEGASAALSRSDFIRAQPVDLPVTDVLAKAKAAGLDLKTGLIYEVRRAMRSKKTTKSAAAKKLPARKQAQGAATPTSKKPASTTGISKSDFIRRQPASLSANEVVARAKAAGIRIEPVLVYKVRRHRTNAATSAPKNGPVLPPTGAKKAAPAKAATPRAAPKRIAVSKKVAPATSATGKSTTSAEDLLRAVASEIGLGRALSILEEHRREVLKVLGG